MNEFKYPGWSSIDDRLEARLRCPHCRHQATFEPPSGHSKDIDSRINSPGHTKAGMRRCPNPDCLGLVFVLFARDSGTIVRTFPPEIIDFDATALPDAVVRSLEEAVKCQAAGCHRAAAIMVRRTLEDVCHDKEIDPSIHDNLRKRLKELGSKSLLPDELIEGLDALRLLGNDAAHIEATTYNDVGTDEVVLAIDVCKEILKAVYQYGSIVGRLAALKATNEAAT